MSELDAIAILLGGIALLIMMLTVAVQNDLAHIHKKLDILIKSQQQDTPNA